MITTSIGFLACLLLIGSSLVFVETKTQAKFFSYVPSIVILYFVIVLLASVGLWDQQAPAIEQTTAQVKSVILPAMIFLMLLGCDLRVVAKLGRKAFIAFFITTVAIMLAFIIVYSILGRWLDPDAWKAFAALNASWSGGTGNMVAVQQAVQAPSEQMGYAMLTDSVCYSIWFAFLFALIAKAPAFDRWVKAKHLDNTFEHLGDVARKKPIQRHDLFFLFAISMGVSAIALGVSHHLPTFGLLSDSVWMILIATGLGLVGAMSPLNRLSGSETLSMILLFLLVSLVASSASISHFSKAPLFVLSGLLILVIQASLVVFFARIFRLNLALCSIASLANIGGIAGASILAAGYGRVFVPVGVLMALLGFVVGSQTGLIVGGILSSIHTLIS